MQLIVGTYCTVCNPVEKERIVCREKEHGISSNGSDLKDYRGLRAGNPPNIY